MTYGVISTDVEVHFGNDETNFRSAGLNFSCDELLWGIDGLSFETDGTNFGVAGMNFNGYEFLFGTAVTLTNNVAELVPKRYSESYICNSQKSNIKYSCSKLGK